MTDRDLNKQINCIGPDLDEKEKTLFSRLYEAYLAGIEEGKKQTQVKLIEALLALLK
jgi:hypothetical protein